jgi:hypothetical protein
MRHRDFITVICSAAGCVFTAGARQTLLPQETRGAKIREGGVLYPGKTDTQRHPNRRRPFWVLILVAALAALLVLPISASAQEEEGRIQITFSKPGYDNGSGYLFYHGQRYGLAVSGTKIGRIWVTTIDFIGTASNLHSAADIIGTYNAGDPEAALVRGANTARLENAKGVALEIRAVNLNGRSTLDLSGMTLKNVGWQPLSE